jgi:hypothetical protein
VQCKEDKDGWVIYILISLLHGIFVIKELSYIKIKNQYKNVVSPGFIMVKVKEKREVLSITGHESPDS